MGYIPAQIKELRQTMEATPYDMVLSATPIDLNRIMSLSKPVKRVYNDIAEEKGAPLKIDGPHISCRKQRLTGS
jgi:predicted GTPase